MFEFDVTDPSLTLTLECWEEGVLSDAYLGNVTLPLKNLSDGNKIRNWYPLTSADFQKESKMNPVKGALKGSVDLGKKTRDALTDTRLTRAYHSSARPTSLGCDLTLQVYRAVPT